MFYCDPCRVKRAWPQSLARSFGRCEICGNERSCYDRPSSTLPLPKVDKNLYRPIDTSDKGPVRSKKIDYSRADKFMSLFTAEEKESWAGRESKAPDWVLEALLWFMGQDPGHQELMRRLKESGD